VNERGKVVCNPPLSEYNNSLLYAEIIVQIDAPGLPQPFTYGIPPGMAVRVGAAVVVPFGSQTAVGHVVGITETCPPEMTAKIKPITGVLEHGADFDEALYELTRWVADQTLCDLRDAVRLIAPEVMTSQIITTLRLAEDWEGKLAGTRSEAQQEIAAALASLGGSAEIGAVAKALERPKLGPALAELRKKGIVTEQRAVRRPVARRKMRKPAGPTAACAD
jgi:primosomal protein N'